MTSRIVRASQLRRLAPAILIATAVFGAGAAVSLEAAGVASARPNQCEDGQCHPPHPPADNGHLGSPSYHPPQQPVPAPTQSFLCDEFGCITV